MSANVGSLLVEIGADLARLRSDMGKASQIVQNQSRTMSKHLAGIDRAASSVSRSIGAIGTAIGAVGVGIGITAMVQEFSDLDRGLIGVKKTTGIAGAELQQLGSDIQKITTELPLTTQELLGIAQAAGQLGVTGSDNILKFTKTVGMLGTASDLSGEEAATTLARLLNVTNESADRVDVLGSVIVALGNNMAAAESDIAKMATEVGQAAGVYGVSSANAAALGATMKSLGIRAELGGSSVGRAFRAIDASIREGGEKMEELERITGMTGDTLRTVFAKDSVAVFQAFIEGLGRMIGQGYSAADVLGRFGLAGEEVLKSLPTLAKRSDELGRALGIAAQETKNATALTIEALEASKSFSAQMRMAGSEINITAAAIGKELAPAIVGISKDFASFVSENKGNFSAFAGDIREFASDLGPIARNVGELFSTTVRGWNKLPTVIQEIGIVGALIGGTKARVAIALIAVAMGQIDKLNKQAAGITDIDKSSALLSQEINYLVNRQKALSSLKTDDELAAFGPAIKQQIAESQGRIKRLQDRIAQVRIDAERDFRVIDNAATQAQEAAGKATSSGGDGGNIITTTVKSKTKFELDKEGSWFEQVAWAAEEATMFGDAMWDEQEKRAEENLQVQTEFSREYIRVIKGETAAKMAEIDRQAAAYIEAGSDEIAVAQWVAQSKLEVSREWQDGATRHLQDYADSATNAAENVGSAFTSAMGGMEDSLVDFVTTGKMEFSDLARSIMADIARIMIRQSITGPLALGISGILGGIFHDGGVVGSATSYRMVDPSVFSGARRYHSGGVAGLAPDEVPAILQRGERVIPKGGSTSGGSLQVNIMNYSGEPVTQQKSVDNYGNARVDVMIGDAAAKQMATPGSSLNRAVRSSTGARQQVVRR